MDADSSEAQSSERLSAKGARTRAQTLSKLIELSENVQLKYSFAQLLKMSDEELTETYINHVSEHLSDVNAQIARVIIMGAGMASKTVGVPGSLEAGCSLMQNDLFMRDIKKVTNWFTPNLPYVGLLVSAVTVGKLGYDWWTQPAKSPARSHNATRSEDNKDRKGNDDQDNETASDPAFSFNFRFKANN